MNDSADIIHSPTPRWPRRGSGKKPFLALALPLMLLGGFSTIAQTTNFVISCDEAEFDAVVSGGGYIAFTQDCSLTLSATVAIPPGTTIDAQGHNVTISGGNLVQLFHLTSGGMTFIGLNLKAGTSTNGGAIFMSPYSTNSMINCTLSGNSCSNGAGGAVYVNENCLAVFTNCIFGGNSAAGTNGLAGNPGSTNNANGIGGDGSTATAGVPGLGGAVYNLGSSIFQNCTLTNNSATAGNGGNGGAGGSANNGGGNGGAGGPGAVAYGGAIYNLGYLSLTNCTLTGNSAAAGNGGIGGAAGSGRFSGLAGNGGTGANAAGGGICSGSGATAHIASCTFSGNKVQGGTSAAGGGQVNGVGNTGGRGGDASGAGFYNGSTAQLLNCTFYNNTVTGGGGGNGGNGSGALPTGGDGGDGGNANGGGIYNFSSRLAATNCTIANCSAVGGTNGVSGSGNYFGSNGNPGGANGGGIANGSGTFIVANTMLASNVAGFNASGSFVPGGYNLSSDATPSSLSAYRGDAQILALANNGGPTMTMAIRSSTSLAYGKVPSGSSPPTDQRGVQRPASGKTHADIGAYELQGTIPAIIGQPQALTIQTNGGSVTLSVSAVGNSLRYLWRFTPTSFYYADNLIPGSASTNFPLSVSSNLTFSSITITNAGTYVVVVTNIAATNASVTSLPAVVTVPPFIVEQPTNTEVHAGFEATFMVVAAAVQQPGYQWIVNQTNAIPNATASTYSANNVQFANNGYTYSVVVSNSTGSVTSVLATLTVDAPPFITAPPTNQVVAVGGNARFSVGAAGTPTLSYQWRFNGQATAGATSTYYPIYSAQSSNAGSYDVIITNRFGSVISSPVTLTVLASQPAQPTPVMLTNAVMGPNGFGFSFYSLCNLTYVVQCTNLFGGLGNWSTVATYPGSNGLIRFVEPATNPAGRLYRVRVQ